MSTEIVNVISSTVIPIELWFHLASFLDSNDIRKLARTLILNHDLADNFFFLNECFRKKEKAEQERRDSFFIEIDELIKNDFSFIITAPIDQNHFIKIETIEVCKTFYIDEDAYLDFCQLFLEYKHAIFALIDSIMPNQEFVIFTLRIIIDLYRVITPNYITQYITHNYPELFDQLLFDDSQKQSEAALVSIYTVLYSGFYDGNADLVAELLDYLNDRDINNLISHLDKSVNRNLDLFIKISAYIRANHQLKEQFDNQDEDDDFLPYDQQSEDEFSFEDY